MSCRSIQFKPNKVIALCPKCQNNTRFVVHSEQCAEDCCNIWAVCKCGYCPTEFDSDAKIEDVWGGCDDDNCKDAIRFTWNEPIEELNQKTPTNEQ